MMGLFEKFDTGNYEEPDKKRFNGVTDEDERLRKLIAGDPNKFLHTNGS